MSKQKQILYCDVNSIEKKKGKYPNPLQIRKGKKACSHLTISFSFTQWEAHEMVADRPIVKTNQNEESFYSLQHKKSLMLHLIFRFISIISKHINLHYIF